MGGKGVLTMGKTVLGKGLGFNAMDWIDAHSGEGAEICAGVSHEIFRIEVVARVGEDLHNTLTPKPGRLTEQECYLCISHTVSHGCRSDGDIF